MALSALARSAGLRPRRSRSKQADQEDKPQGDRHGRVVLAVTQGQRALLLHLFQALDPNAWHPIPKSIKDARTWHAALRQGWVAPLPSKGSAAPLLRLTRAGRALAVALTEIAPSPGSL